MHPGAEPHFGSANLDVDVRGLLMIVGHNELRRQLRRLHRWWPQEPADLAETIVLSRATPINGGRWCELPDLVRIKAAIAGAISQQKELVVELRHSANAHHAEQRGLTPVTALAEDAVTVTSLAKVDGYYARLWLKLGSFIEEDDRGPAWGAADVI